MSRPPQHAQRRSERQRGQLGNVSCRRQGVRVFLPTAAAEGAAWRCGQVSELRGPGSPPQACLPTEEETHPVDLSSLSSKLLPGFTTLGFKDERRGKGECRAVLGRAPNGCRPTCCWSCAHVLIFESRNKTKVL